MRSSGPGLAADPPVPRNLISSQQSKHVPDRLEKQHYILTAASSRVIRDKKELLLPGCSSRPQLDDISITCFAGRRPRATLQTLSFRHTTYSADLSNNPFIRFCADSDELC
jgi:hypothetical protein